LPEWLVVPLCLTWRLLGSEQHLQLEVVMYHSPANLGSLAVVKPVEDWMQDVHDLLRHQSHRG
jgi:hypothetical protein